MGSPESERGRGKDEGPQHPVTIAQPFAVGKFEVTFNEWDACVTDRGCTYTPGDEGWGRGRHPVINVSWNDIQQYLAWLSKKTGKEYRLLSEAEWEYAARGVTKTSDASTPFFTGQTINYKQANYDANFTYGSGQQGAYRQKTTDVGTFPRNAFGLYDMHGNVWEWVRGLLQAVLRRRAVGWLARELGRSAICMFFAEEPGTTTPSSCVQPTVMRPRADIRLNNFGFRVARAM